METGRQSWLFIGLYKIDPPLLLLLRLQIHSQDRKPECNLQLGFLWTKTGRAVQVHEKSVHPRHTTTGCKPVITAKRCFQTNDYRLQNNNNNSSTCPDLLLNTRLSRKDQNKHVNKQNITFMFLYFAQSAEQRIETNRNYLLKTGLLPTLNKEDL